MPGCFEVLEPVRFGILEFVRSEIFDWNFNRCSQQGRIKIQKFACGVYEKVDDGQTKKI